MTVCERPQRQQRYRETDRWKEERTDREEKRNESSNRVRPSSSPLTRWCQTAAMLERLPRSDPLCVASHRANADADLSGGEAARLLCFSPEMISLIWLIHSLIDCSVFFAFDRRKHFWNVLLENLSCLILLDQYSISINWKTAFLLEKNQSAIKTDAGSIFPSIDSD